VPHLTVAHDAPERILAEAEGDVTTRLPVSAEVVEAWLITFDGARWTRHASLPLGPAA
jgi:hypothetical protein